MGKYRAGHAAARRSRKVPIITAAVMTAVLASAAGMTSLATAFAQDTPVTSTVIDQGKQYSIAVASTDADVLLEAADITLGHDDLLVVQSDSTGTTVTVKRKINAEITVGDKTVQAQGYSGETVEEMLKDSGVAVTALDRVSPSRSTVLWDDAEIQIEAQKEVYIVDQKTAKRYVVPAGTAAEAVKAAGIELGKEDSIADPKAQVEDGAVININRVTYQTYQKTGKMDYKTVEKETDDLKLGETKVETEGAEGKEKITYRQKLVNGEVVSTEKTKTEVIEKPVDEVVLIGTYKEPEKVQQSSAPQSDSGSSNTNTTAAPQTSGSVILSGATQSGAAGFNRGAYQAGNGSTFVDLEGRSVRYLRTVTGSGTAYYAPPGALTASGAQAAVGRVAVNPNVIPYGTHLFIASTDGSYVYGYAIASDTGGALMDGSAVVDLFMNDLSECTSFGRHNVIVYVLD